MNELEKNIREEIAAKGPMRVDRYMHLALQHPEYGYYKKGDPLGAKGDFITAPEVSQMFGEIIGLWFADVWRQMGSPSPFVLLELGPGRGTMLRDALRAVQKVPGFLRAARLYLYESSTTLRGKQIENLGTSRPTFIEDLGKLPALPLLFIANEFFDALPIRQFIEKNKVWKERRIGVHAGKLTFEDTGEDLSSDFFKGEPKGFVEVCEAATPFLTALSARLVLNGGAGLVIDYGYGLPIGCNTLQAVAKHERTDPLNEPGQVDLTAHVDFLALARIVEKLGICTAGPIPQGEFLETLGIELRAMQLKNKATDTQRADIDSGLKRLVDPSEMGFLFKVMAFYNPSLKQVAGF